MGMATLTVSHAVIASNDVGRITHFFSQAFDILPHFEQPEFCEFVLRSGFRLAFFKPVGKSKQNFSADSDRSAISLGITVEDVDSFYKRHEIWCAENHIQPPAPPKEHPWGEKSFLLIDPDDNRWEVTQSPTQSGMLVTRKSP